MTERPQPRLGQMVSMTGDDGLVGCLYCGYRAKLLSPHLKHRHGVTAAEYRAEHNLPRGASMAADSVRADASEKRHQMLEDDPTMLDHLKRFHSAEHLTEMNRRSAEAVRESQRHPIASSHRAPGREWAVTRMVEQRLAKLDAAAQEHGFADAADAVARTAHLTHRAAARATGLSPQTIKRRRAVDPIDVNDEKPPGPARVSRPGGLRGSAPSTGGGVSLTRGQASR